MKTRLILSLTVALMLIATLALPAMAVQIGTETAYVTVNSQMDVTVSDEGSDGIRFGSLYAATNNNPDEAQLPGTPSVTISVAGTAVVDLQIKGDDFGAGFAVTNVKYNFSDDYTGAPTMTTSDNTYASSVTPDTTINMWFWIDVPSSGVIADDYESIFTFSATDVTPP
jgi:hypothetical protein